MEIKVALELHRKPDANDDTLVDEINDILSKAHSVIKKDFHMSRIWTITDPASLDGVPAKDFANSVTLENAPDNVIYRTEDGDVLLEREADTLSMNHEEWTAHVKEIFGKSTGTVHNIIGLA